jgi:hypothetical protein
MVYGVPVRPPIKNRYQDSGFATGSLASMRGIAKDIYAEDGGGGEYLGQEREAFNADVERREVLIAEAMGLSANEGEIAKDES